MEEEREANFSLNLDRFAYDWSIHRSTVALSMQGVREKTKVCGLASRDKGKVHMCIIFVHEVSIMIFRWHPKTVPVRHASSKIGPIFLFSHNMLRCDDGERRWILCDDLLTMRNKDFDIMTANHMLWNKGKDRKVEELRSIADRAFCQDEFVIAAQYYRDAACILLDHHVKGVELDQDTRELVNLFSQQSECLFRLEKWLEASQVAEQALSLDPDHVPSLYRHAISNWRGHVPTGKDFGHLVFWASASQSYDRMVQLDSMYMRGESSSDPHREDASKDDGLFLYSDSDSEDLIADLRRLPLKKRIKNQKVEETTEPDKEGQHSGRNKKGRGDRRTKSKASHTSNIQKNQKKKSQFKSSSREKKVTPKACVEISNSR